MPPFTCAAKSNAIHTAFNAAQALVKASPDYAVPNHLRNAPTQLAKSMGHGDEYRYAHNEDHAFAAGENYFPEALQAAQFYFPSERGLEGKIAEKLEKLHQLNQQSDNKRYQ